MVPFRAVIANRHGGRHGYLETIGEVLQKRLQYSFQDQHGPFVKVAIILTADERNVESQPRNCHESGLGRGRMPSCGGRLLMKFLNRG